MSKTVSEVRRPRWMPDRRAGCLGGPGRRPEGPEGVMGGRKVVMEEKGSSDYCDSFYLALGGGYLVYSLLVESLLERHGHLRARWAGDGVSWGHAVDRRFRLALRALSSRAVGCKRLALCTALQLISDCARDRTGNDILALRTMALRRVCSALRQ